MIHTANNINIWINSGQVGFAQGITFNSENSELSIRRIMLENNKMQGRRIGEITFNTSFLNLNFKISSWGTSSHLGNQTWFERLTAYVVGEYIEDKKDFSTSLVDIFKNNLKTRELISDNPSLELLDNIKNDIDDDSKLFDDLKNIIKYT